MTQRILLATDSQEPSGLGEHMLTLGAALGDAFDVTLAMPDHPPGRSLLTRAARLGLGVKSLDLDQPGPLRRWMASLGPALLHVHAGIGWESHDLVRHGKAAGLPVVRTEHLPYLLTSPVQQAQYRAMLLNLDARIAVSAAVHDSHLGAGGGKQTIVRNGVTVPMPTANRADTRRALGLQDNHKLLLTVARFAPQKGHAVLVDAAPAILSGHPNVVFVLVGTGPDQDAIADHIARAGLQDNFVSLGHRNDVPNLLAAADLVVLPSLFEGLSLALLEAMAARVPVVATSVGGLVEGLGSRHPFLVPAGEAEALATVIVRALDRPDEAQASVEAAAQRFDARFAARRMSEETAAVYHSVLRQQDPQGKIS